VPAAASAGTLEQDACPPQWHGGAGETVRWFLPGSSRPCLRLAGRRSRDEELELANSPGLPQRCFARLVYAAPKWLLALALTCVMLLAAPADYAQAAPRPPDVDEDAPATDVAQNQASRSEPAEPKTRVVSRKRPVPQEKTVDEEGEFPRTPFYGMPNVVVTDPAEYPRPRSLECDDPNSFWYTMRPNIFNIPVEAAWDFYNIINTDRPDFTDAVYSVGKGVSILETGYTFTKINTPGEHFSTRELPESLLRHGITNEFEVRLKWFGYLMTDITDPHSGAQLNTFGSQDIDVAFKWEIVQQQGWRPMTTLVSGMTLPTGTPGTSANFVQPHFNLLAGWGFRRWLYLKWQTGCDFLHATNTQIVTPLQGSTPIFLTATGAVNSWHESLSLLTQVTKRVGAFHEWYMISPTGAFDTRAQHFLDMGLYIYATPNVQFDVRVGRQLSDREDYFFTGAGFSGRW
jgi:hypothetical protein